MHGAGFPLIGAQMPSVVPCCADKPMTLTMSQERLRIPVTATLAMTLITLIACA